MWGALGGFRKQENLLLIKYESIHGGEKDFYKLKIRTFFFFFDAQNPQDAPGDGWLGWEELDIM